MDALKPAPAAAPEPQPAEGAPYVLEEQIGFRLRKAHQRASEIFGAVMGAFDVTPTQFAALAKLDDVGPIAQNQLGRLVAMDPATIFGVVGRLAKRGLVESRADDKDARVALVALTPAGRDAVRRMKEVAAQVSERTLAPLSRREAETLLRLLAKVE